MAAQRSSAAWQESRPDEVWREGHDDTILEARGVTDEGASACHTVPAALG